MPKSVDQIMAELASQGITVSTSNPKGAVTAIIRDSAKRTGNYYCSKCKAAADHDDEGHEPSDAGMSSTTYSEEARTDAGGDS